tara:strand:+ start:527 stop:1021 length:495 start_codon:yes stop_codon:yes gene_type:complete
MSSASQYDSTAKLYDYPYEYDGLQTPLYKALVRKNESTLGVLRAFGGTIFLRGMDGYLFSRMDKVGSDIPNSWKAWKQECSDLKRLMWLMNRANNEYLAFCETHFDSLCTSAQNLEHMLEQVKVEMTKTNLENERLKAENERLKAELAEINTLPIAECHLVKLQ